MKSCCVSRCVKKMFHKSTNVNSFGILVMKRLMTHFYKIKLLLFVDTENSLKKGCL